MAKKKSRKLSLKVTFVVPGRATIPDMQKFVRDAMRHYATYLIGTNPSTRELADEDYKITVSPLILVETTSYQKDS